MNIKEITNELENVAYEYGFEVKSSINYSKAGQIDKVIFSISRDIPSKERDNAEDSDFVVPENRSFPILKPSDIPAAVHAFGRGKNNLSFEEFKARVIRIAKRKGFESSLPKEWKDDK